MNWSLRALSLAAALPLATSGCAFITDSVNSLAEGASNFTIPAVKAEVLTEIHAALSEVPGVDTVAVYSDGTPILDVAENSLLKRGGVDLTVPVADDIPTDGILAIHNAAINAVNASQLEPTVSADVTYVRRGGTDSASTWSQNRFTLGRSATDLQYWWTLSETPGVKVTVGQITSLADLIVDASALPDSSPEAVPTIDRLRQILDNPPPEPFSTSRERWVVRDRGPAVSITGRADHLLDQSLWDSLTTPGLDGVVEEIEINGHRASRLGRLMTADRSVHEWPEVPEDGKFGPSTATLVLHDLDSPVFAPEAIRALHAARTPHTAHGLRYLNLKLDPQQPDYIAMSIDLKACSSEAAESLIAKAAGSLPASSAVATLSRAPSSTAPSPRYATDKDPAKRAAWELWERLGCS